MKLWFLNKNSKVKKTQNLIFNTKIFLMPLKILNSYYLIVTCQDHNSFFIPYIKLPPFSIDTGAHVQFASLITNCNIILHHEIMKICILWIIFDLSFFFCSSSSYKTSWCKSIKSYYWTKWWQKSKTNGYR